MNTHVIVAKSAFFLSLLGATLSVSASTPALPQLSEQQQAAPSLSADLAASIGWIRRYPVHITAAVCAGALAYHLWNLKETPDEKQDGIKSKTARWLGMGLCVIIGLAAISGQDNTLRGVDYLAGLKFILDVTPKLEI